MTMRKFIVFTICIIFSATFIEAKDVAQQRDDMLKKWIEKYDVPVAVRNIKGKEHRKQYWEALVSENPRLKKLYEDIAKNKGAEKEAVEHVNKMRVFHPQTDPYVVNEMDSDVNYFRDYIGVSPDLCSVHVYRDSVPTTAIGLTVDGKFAVFVNSGLLVALGKDNMDMLEPIIAHEIAHGLLSHHLSTEYYLAKKKRKDKLVSGLAVGLGAAVGVAGAGLLGFGFVPVPLYDPKSDAVIEVTKNDLLSGYRYTEGNEIEADLAAYRYFDQIEGDGDMYIEYLRSLYLNSPKPTEEELVMMQKPPVALRLALVRYAAEHQEVVSTADSKIFKEKKN